MVVAGVAHADPLAPAGLPPVPGDASAALAQPVGGDVVHGVVSFLRRAGARAADGGVVAGIHDGFVDGFEVGAAFAFRAAVHVTGHSSTPCRSVSPMTPVPGNRSSTVSPSM